ncbi:MAG: septum site-determining protein MinC [Oleiphilus sp.]|nr:MAG: septum site-determining protein MinC [Oleiphilus sp.]
MSSSLTAEPSAEHEQTNTDTMQDSFDFERNEQHPENGGQMNEPSQEQEQVNMSVAPHSGRPCMQLKGALVPMTVLELNYFELEQFTRDIKAKTSQAPDFFDNLPIVIGLEKFEENGSLPFKQLIEACQEQSIRVVAVRGGSELLQSAAKQAGLGLLPKQKERQTVETAETASPELPEPSENTQAAQQQETPTVQTQVETVEIIKKVIQKEKQISKVVHQPVRSGQQVYAPDGDLIVLASVSAGAEILADGNIHVYGSLRGRALAGVKGDTQARIFCHSMAAELVSIAGQYKISEDIDRSVLGKPTQVYLDKDALRFKEIDL